MRRCKPGMMEYQLESIFLHEAFSKGNMFHLIDCCNEMPSHNILYSQVGVGMLHTLASVVLVNMEPFCTMAML